MGRIIICDTKEANTPYFLKTIGKKVFSYEELCYYMYQNTALLLDGFIEEALLVWLKEELELVELVKRLESFLEAKILERDMMVYILKEKGFYNEFEIKDFVILYNRLELMSREQILKEKAQCYVKNGLYLKALDIYDEILEIHRKNRLDTEFLGTIYHNQASCLAYNLELVQAKDIFLKAYELTHYEVSIRAYFLILYLLEQNTNIEEEKLQELDIPFELYQTITEEIEQQFDKIKSLRVYKEIERANYEKKRGNVNEYYTMLDNIIYVWKQEYKKQIIIQ